MLLQELGEKLDARAREDEARMLKIQEEVRALSTLSFSTPLRSLLSSRSALFSLCFLGASIARFFFPALLSRRAHQGRQARLRAEAQHQERIKREHQKKIEIKETLDRQVEGLPIHLPPFPSLLAAQSISLLPTSSLPCLLALQSTKHPPPILSAFSLPPLSRLLSESYVIPFGI